MSSGVWLMLQITDCSRAADVHSSLHAGTMRASLTSKDASDQDYRTRRVFESMNDYDFFFDFTSDTPGYWDNFWENGNGLGQGSADPDKYSPTLKEFHKRAWRRELPNG